ncbi:hypothetical protein PR048_006184 [Dryococelus australis]|uniref:Uncharacterized protein n=1 Tax=Dryococelus australis TaxID=614101 RepID=A0ABQ9IA90_9NEOP|nr:hypothetical protein PR048_006184 [Dryococelus australis]
MFLNTYHVNVPYKVYWSIFTQEFNIKFGFPRLYTCSICDTLALKINNPECSTEKRKKLETEKRKQARAGNIVCLSFDYLQNLPLPHLKTNAVFIAINCSAMCMVFMT